MKRRATILAVILILALIFTTSTAFAGTFMSRYIGESTAANIAKTYEYSDAFSSCILVDGLDVSVYQQGIDWKKAKANGVDFAIIRIGGRGYGTEGNMYRDANFKTYFDGARAAGVMVGLYFFSQATNELEAEAEVDFAYEILTENGYTPADLDLPLYMDYEFSGGTTGRLTKAKLTKAKATSVVRAWIDQAKELGFNASVYANLKFLNDTIDGKALSEELPIWVAQYYTICQYKYEYNMWQYTSSGSVNGVTKAANDCDVWFLNPLPTATSEKSLANASVALSQYYYTYDGVNAFTPTAYVSLNGTTLVENVDYRVRYVRNAQAGTAFAYVYGIGEYTEYKVEPFNISPSTNVYGIQVADIADVYWDPASTTPAKPASVSLTAPNGSKLYRNLDYTYVVSNNYAPGTGVVTITFNGNYFGSKTAYFEIKEQLDQIVTTKYTKYTRKINGEGFNVKAETNGDGKLTYKSSDESVATIDSNGNVTLVGIGTVEFTVSAAETKKYKAGEKIVTLVINDLTEEEKQAIIEAEEEAKRLEEEKKRQEEEEKKRQEEAAKAEHDRIVTGVKETTISLKSSLTSKGIKLEWEKSAGFKVDYYQVYRSIKKDSGYGTSPIFKTEDSKKVSYVNTKNLKKGVRYYFKVRAVRMVDDEKAYTKYSNKVWRTWK